MKIRHESQAAGGILVKGIGRKRLSISALAIGLTIGAAAPLSAQTNFVVDLADPNVHVDLSVLNDGGLAPQMGAPAPMGSAPSVQTSAGGYKAPGKKAPVSRLHIQPTSQFRLPPQTKPIEAPVTAAAAKPKMMPVAPMPKLKPIPESLPAPVPPVAMKPSSPPPPPPVAAIETPAPLPSSEPQPEPAPEPEAVAASELARPHAPEPQKEEIAAILEKVPAAPEPAKPAEVTPPAPAPAPVEAVEEVAKAEPVEEQTKRPVQLAPPPPPIEDEIKEVAAAPAPPPPPVAEPAPEPAPVKPQAALTPPPAPAAPAPVEHDETDTASSAAKGDGAMVIPPKAEETEVAAVPPSSGLLTDGQSLRILFNADSSKLPPAARDQLTDIATKMQSQDNMRLQLLAYAANPDMSASAARRLSLSRALAVRSFLIENGVRSTRIDVRALGNKSSDPQTERVDITVVER